MWDYLLLPVKLGEHIVLWQRAQCKTFFDYLYVLLLDAPPYLMPIWYTLACFLLLFGFLANYSSTILKLLQHGKTNNVHATTTTTTTNRPPQPRLHAMVQYIVDFHVPKQWFTYFYVVGVVWNSMLMVVQVYTFMWVESSDPRFKRGRPPPFLQIVYNAHLLRRAYECVHVHLFSLGGTMHLFHFIFGLCYYFLTSTTIYVRYEKMFRLTLNDIIFSFLKDL